MAIQKFKFGQEITSSKLNEIVTFVNNLEGFLQSSQYWNENVDSKIAVFQTQLNNIVNQVKGLLDSSESFETLLTAFIDLKAKYESLVTQNIQILLENIFNPTNVTVNSGGFFVINGITTNVQLTTLVGPQGANGQDGADGATGASGKTILTGTTNPDNNNGVDGDLYFNRNNFNFHIKENSVWVLVGTLKGPQGNTGPQGGSAQILFRYQTDVGLPYLTQPPASNLIKFLEYKVIYSNETNQQIEIKPWIRIQVRNDRFFPVLTSGTEGQLFLNWSSNETTWSENPQGVNIRGGRGIDGINGTNGTNGTSVSIKGNFASHTNLPTSGAILGDGYLINGFLWVYTAGTTTGTPPAVLSVVNGFLNVGEIQGPPGPAPIIQADVVETLNPAEEASVAVEPISGVEGGYRLEFSIPKGDTGTRGSLIFSVATPEDLPTQASWNSITLLVNDLFIVASTGEIRRLVAITPTWDLALVFTAAASVHTHSADNITSGVLPVSRGGTSATTTADVRVNLSLNNVNNTSDLNKPISTATQTALNLKANLNAPTFTGTVSGITANMVGLGNVTNESKATMFSSPTFTGTVSGVTASMVGLGNVTNESKATMFTSPAFTVTPTAPTATAGTNTTQIATTAFVSTAVANLINSAPGALDTLDELAAALGDDASFASTVTNSLAGKAASSHTHAISDVTSLQTSLDGKASTTHSHLITLFGSSPVTISNTSPFTTITLSGNVTAGDRLLIRWGPSISVQFWSETFLIATSGSDYYAVIEKRLDGISSSDTVAILSVQMGTHTTSGSYTGNQLTFRNGMFQSGSGTQTTQTMYVQLIYKVVL
jgi:hypothetical protein